MKKPRRIAITLVAVALGGTLIAAAALDSALTSPPTDDGSRGVAYDGYYTPADTLWAGNVTTPNGTASIGYTITLSYQSADPRQRLTCGLIDDRHSILSGPQPYSYRTASVVGRTTTLTFTAAFSDLPAGNMELACHPTSTGHLALAISDARVTATTSP